MYCFLDGSRVRRLVVAKDQTEHDFSECLRRTFPQLANKDYDLCKVDSHRNVIQLNLQTVTPAAITGGGILGRSALYIRGKVM